MDDTTVSHSTPISQATGSPSPEEDLENFRRLADNLPMGVLIHRDDAILYANATISQLCGLPPDELRSRPYSALFDPDARPALADLIRAMEQLEQTPVPAEMALLRGDAPPLPVELALSTTTYRGQGAIISVIRDITCRKEDEARIRHQANFDQLTGLPNRTLFMDRLEQELVRASRNRRHVALMFIDLDRFKWVNDTLGHQAGDDLLKETAQRLKGCLRRSDTVARLGGDEFTVILPDMVQPTYAERLAREILTQLASPYELEGQEVFISGSVGITTFPDDAGTLADLLRNADSAMYRAKRDGRNAYRFFTPDLHTEALERVALEKDLRHALEREELVIHYQPIMDLESGRVVGAECFLRWHHPQRGEVPPNRFVPLAEETGLIGELTHWALETACRQAAQWRQRRGHEAFFVSVNLSCTRCRELSTDNVIPGILKKTGLPPAGLRLEITETILGEDPVKAMAMLEHLNRLGVKLWLDDFGTGASSLSVLRRLPLNGVKIDQTFVQDVQRDAESAVLVRGIISLARSLHLEVVGEGVETPYQRRFLQEHSCRLAQGYHFGKPLPAAGFASCLE